LAGLRFLQREKLVAAVSVKADFFRSRLSTHPAVKEIRIAGFMMALELGSFDLVMKVIGTCLEEGLITDWFLHCNTALRLAPPLTIAQEEMEEACRILLLALDKLS
jgi:acetylornithine/succinyldiaminopimelate/putrescine aminotransferase